ncbi:hypothetical protein FQR65_LT18944 [Abscondita terminalis]|nr:hypothetical protein FQR65_LT18944 [Abscondita terminalis]
MESTRATKILWSIMYENSSREPSVSPDRTHKVSREDEDFYTLNIKVYKTDSQTSKKKTRPITDDEEVYSDDEIPEKRLEKPVESAKGRPGKSSTKIYRTEEKHFVNKSVKQQSKPKAHPKDETSQRRSPTKQVQKVVNTRRTTTVKPKLEKRERLLLQQYKLVPKSKPQEVVVKLQRSKSSRETTPDHTYVYPASDNEDKGLPRYPDEIYEPTTVIGVENQPNCQIFKN